MNVVFLHRKPLNGMFSIETVFGLVKNRLSSIVTISDFYASGNVIADGFRTVMLTADVFHITGHVHYFGLFLPGKKTVLTIHDVGHYEKTLKGIKKWIYKMLWFYLPLKRVQTITTISNFTKQRICHHFNIAPERVRVIYNPVDPQYRPGQPQRNRVPVILQIGSGHNKNLDNLVEAVRGIECKLVLVNRLNPSMLKRLTDYGIVYEQKFNLSKSELLETYQKSDILFFASTYEGFGLPIIEAQACGIPVITSNFGSMQEITENGQSAHLVDPTSVPEITAGIHKIVNDDVYRLRLIENGFVNSKRFSNDVIAMHYWELYQSMGKTGAQ